MRVEQQTAVFRALADPSRRAILEQLARGESSVKDLTARFDISQPAVSQHLAALRSAGLVRERKDGRHVHYRIEPRGLKPIVDWIAHYQAFWMSKLGKLQQVLEEME